MECVFIVPALLLLAFLPVPPHRGEIGAFVVLSSGIVAASLIWWGLRSPTRLAWWGALALAGAWSLNSIKIVVLFWKVMASIFTGHAAMPADGSNAVVLSYLFAGVPAIAQAIVLVTWLRGSSHESPLHDG
jgi:hypothetical protein